MLSRIFGFGQKKHNKKIRLSDSNDDSWLENFHLIERGLPNFERSQIRLLVFKDHDRNGDKCVIFDSKTALRDEAEQNEEGGRPARRRLSSDVQLLGEMIFGSVEMTYKGPTVKVHSIRTPPQLLLTKVFALKPPRASHSSSTAQLMSDYLQSSSRFTDSVCDSVSSQQNSSDSEDQAMARSVPVFPNSPSSHGFKLKNVVEDFSTAMSESGRSLNATFPRTSSGSYQRRWLRSQVTRMEYGCVRRNESFNEEMSMRLRRRPKIGIGVLFSLWEDKETCDENNRLFQSFCFSHFPLIESHIHKLQRRIEKALLTSLQMSGKSFQEAVHVAINIFADCILNLYYAPRIRNPVWLTMLSQPDQCDSFCEDLVPQLVSAIEIYNTKEKKFFLSSLLTAVLTYHVAWVTTVTPSPVQARRAYLDKHSSEILNVLGVSHPYNPLWAQLSDLYGAGGDPTRIARTVILGKDKHLVTLLLHILSYFIRCSEVYEEPVDQTREFSTPSLDSFSISISSTSAKLTASVERSNILESQEYSEQSLESSGKMLESSGIDLQVSENVPELSESEEHVSESFSQSSTEDFRLNSKEKLNESFFEKTLCEQCNRLSVTMKEQPLKDHFLERTVEACTCSGVFTGNSKENKLWKSFLRRSCCDKACRSLDHSYLPKNQVSEETLNRCGSAPKLIRRHGSEKKFDSHTHQNGTFCIQNEGKTISLDRQSIMNMFFSSFPLCPICQGQLSFVARDVIRANEGKRVSVESGICHECDKFKTCSCQMLDSELNMNSRCASSITVNSDGYSSSNSLQSLEAERGSLSSVSIDSGLNIQCLQSTDCTVEDRRSSTGEPYLLELLEFGPCREDKDVPNANPLDCQLFSFGRSLMAGYCDHYLPDFVLHGTHACTEEQQKYDLKVSLEQPVVDSPVLESVLIIGDTNNWECTVKSQRKPRRGVGIFPSGSHSKKGDRSSLVNEFLTSFCNLWNMNMSAQFCLMHLEDKMKEIYLRSKVISEYLLTQKKYITPRDLMLTFGYGECDLALLMSVVGVHSPQAISRMPVL